MSHTADPLLSFAYSRKFVGPLGEIDTLAGPSGLPVNLDRAAMSASCILATTNTDRETEIIEVTRGRFDNHRRNSVAMLDHGRRYPLPVGLTRKDHRPDGDYLVHVDPDREEIRQTTYFSQKTAMGVQVYTLIDEGILGANSLGFQTIRSQPTGRNKPDGSPAQHILEWDLIEATWTALPVNPEAVRKSLDRGRLDNSPMLPELRYALEPWAAQPRPWSNGMKSFDESKVTRGQPENSGQFASGGGHEAPATTPAKPDAPKPFDKPAAQAAKKPFAVDWRSDPRFEDATHDLEKLVRERPRELSEIVARLGKKYPRPLLEEAIRWSIQELGLDDFLDAKERVVYGFKALLGGKSMAEKEDVASGETAPAKTDAPATDASKVEPFGAELCRKCYAHMKSLSDMHAEALPIFRDEANRCEKEPTKKHLMKSMDAVGPHFDEHMGKMEDHFAKQYPEMPPLAAKGEERRKEETDEKKDEGKKPAGTKEEPEVKPVAPDGKSMTAGSSVNGAPQSALNSSAGGSLIGDPHRGHILQVCKSLTEHCASLKSLCMADIGADPSAHIGKSAIAELPAPAAAALPAAAPATPPAPPPTELEQAEEEAAQELLRWIDAEEKRLVEEEKRAVRIDRDLRLAGVV